MRILGVGETCDLGALYLALKAEGHEVRVHVSDPLAQGTLAGMVQRAPDWRAELDWIRAAPDLGVILFESVSEGYGALQDQLRAEGFKVVGGSAYGDRLENDRAYALEVLAELGFPGEHVHRFESEAEALAFVEARPGRYALKFSGADHAAGRTFIGRLEDGRDVAAVLKGRIARGGEASRLILMSVIEGVEMGVGAFFDGDKFLRPACLDWEHKRFFAGDLGELTGEMGTVVTYARTERFFERTLGLMEGRLREAGHVGWANLNTIVNAEGIWPLEFTCRFGYPGYAILAPLQTGGWGALIRAMATGEAERHQTSDDWCLGVVMTTPPFPYSRPQVDEAVGLPVMIGDAVDGRHVHFGEVGLDEAGQLVTSGLYGWTLVVTGQGADLRTAQRRAYAQAAGIVIPDCRYRLDIGQRLIEADLAQVERLGLFDPILEDVGR